MMKRDIERAIAHIGETNSIRRTFWSMDEKVKDLLYGIKQGDDAAVVGDMVVNMEGPYPLKTARKTGLIHTCSDVVVMGAKPLFALNAIQVDSLEVAEEIARDLKKQSDGLGVPIIGGNTQMESGLKPCASFTVVGRGVAEKPIPDSGASAGDRILMLGQVVEGEIGQRLQRVKVRYASFFDLIEEGIEINAAKDASRGGWFGNLTEMLVKAKKGATITGIPYPRISRYMGVFLLSVPKKEVPKIIRIASQHNCQVVEFATVTKKMEIEMGGETVVSRDRMLELVKNTPYRKARGEK